MCSYRSCQRLLRHESCFFKGTANTNTNYNRWACIRTCILYSRYNSIHCAFHTICRLKHKYSAHIFASKSLRCYGKLNIFSWNDTVMNNRRCIIFCIFSDKRIIYY